MELTTENLISEVRKLAKEQPDFVYPKTKEAVKDEENGESNTLTCFYRSDEHHVACIFGQAFKRMGIEAPKEWEGKSIFALQNPRAAQLVTRLPITDATFTQMKWCNEVQRNQDGGKRWGDCVGLADMMHPL